MEGEEGMKAIKQRSFTFQSTALVAAVVLAALALVFSVNDSVAQQTNENTFRLLTFEVGNSGPRLGTTRGNGEQDIVDVHNAVLYLVKSGAPEVKGLAPIPIDMRSLIEAGDASVQAVKTVHEAITQLRASGNFTDPGGSMRVFQPSAGVKYLPPVPNPSKILAAAGAYQRVNPDGTPGSFDNVEYGSFFMKPPSGMIGNNENINLRGLLTAGVYEPEFAIIIGKRAKFVLPEDALDYVFGYTNLDDVSSRDLPMGHHNSQGSTISKGLDTFTPNGPYITLKEDVPNPSNLEIIGAIDGVRHQWPVNNGNTKFLTFTPQETISYLSERVTLEPGDIISTGVPSPSMAFKEGQTIEITIGNLGTLRNHVVSEPEPGWTPIKPAPGSTPPSDN
jgi:2-keto-4-pentenoate hydratase/2-oxohepta-3-ene-1,7-dioic acid hydratase in catechol pathway